ncbi:Rpn family recombination-promoting nuclease/putative transposase, partial [Floridanema evergladense]
MKTDSLFYRLFQTFPSIFFELINRPPEEANNYQFSSVEIKQTAFRIDGVFLPASGEENPIYFLEVQFQPDSEFYSRFFAEIFLYLRQNKPENDWRAVVLYPNQSTDTGDTAYCNTSIRKVALRFGVAKSFVQKLLLMKKTQGHVEPRQQGGAMKGELDGAET